MPLRELIRRKGLLTVILALVAIGGVAACDGDPAHGGAPSPDPGAWETLATPTFDPPQGTFASAPRVTISAAGAGATIRYTLDGSTPNASSSMYVSPLSIARTATLKAMAFKPGWRESAVQSGTYTIEIPPGTVEPVHFEPNAGDFANDVAVGLSSKTEGAALCYTLDGSTPTCDGGRCGGCSTRDASVIPAEITQTDRRIRAIACKSGMVPSSETYADYTLTAAKPVFDPAPGPLYPPRPVAITSATRDAEIHYTVNGAAPDCQSPILTTGKFPAVFTEDSTVKAIACKKNYVPSDVVTAGYSNVVCRGNFKIKNRAQLEALSHCKMIVGAIEIDSTQDVVDLTPLRQLQRVMGFFGLMRNSGLKSLHGLEALTSIGTLQIDGNNALSSLDGLEALTEVSTLSVWRNSALTRLDALSSLRTVDDLSVGYNAVTEWIGPSSLSKLQELSIAGEKELTHLGGFSGLTEIRDSLEIEHNDKLSVLDGMPALTVLGSATFIDNVSLHEVSGFANVHELLELKIRSNGLTSFHAFAGATKIQRGLTIEKSPDLKVLDLSKVASIGALSLSDLPVLPSLDGLRGLTEVNGAMSLGGALGFANLRGLDNLTTLKGMLSISKTSGLLDLQGLNNLTTAKYVDVLQNAHLQSLRGLDKLATIEGILDHAIAVQDNPELVDIGGLNALADLPASMGIVGNPKLSHLDALHGVTSAKGIYIQFNPALAKLDGLDALVHVKGPLSLYENGLVTLEELHGLEDVTGSLDIQEKWLTTLTGLRSLTSVGGFLSIGQCNALSSLDGLGALRSIGNLLTIDSNASLVRFDLPQLTMFGGLSFEAVHNPKLPSCQPYAVVKRLQALGYKGTIDIRDNDETTSCN